MAQQQSLVLSHWLEVFLLFLGSFPQCWEKDHITDRFLVCHDHSETVDANAETTGGWHAYFESFDEVFVQYLGFLVALSTLAHLVFKTRTLIERVVELGEGVAALQTTNENLETIAETRDGCMMLGKR